MFLRALTIDRFRGIEHLEWKPAARLNGLIGPGDAGKSTVLAAIELLLDPRPFIAVSEFDYHRRRTEAGFEITGVIGDLGETVAAMRNPPLQGWLNGSLVPLPDEDGAEPVVVVRVSGSADLEVTHGLLMPGGLDSVPFGAAQRRRFRLSRVAGSSRASTEFRLGRGTLLDHHVGMEDLRAPLRSAVSAASSAVQLPEDATATIQRLQELFRAAGLPDDLSLSIITPQGWSLLAMVGLVQGELATEAIPLNQSGAGTRQLALFELASALIEGAPMIVLDEPEIGLEPYRQRRLIAKVRRALGESGQAFITTHSPAVLSALEVGEVSRLVPEGSPVTLGHPRIRRIQKRTPTALLSRLPVLCEGETEAGLLRALLNARSQADGIGDLDTLGIELVPCGGQPSILDEAQAVLESGLACGLFVDNELNLAGRRAELAGHASCAYGSYATVRNIEEALSIWLSWEELSPLVDLAAELSGREVDSLMQQVASQAQREGELSLETIRDSIGEEATRAAVAAAMQSKNGPWFKSLDRGEALGEHLLARGLPEALNELVAGFWRRVREVSGWG